MMNMKKKQETRLRIRLAHELVVLVPRDDGGRPRARALALDEVEPAGRHRLLPAQDGHRRRLD